MIPSVPWIECVGGVPVAPSAFLPKCPQSLLCRKVVASLGDSTMNIKHMCLSVASPVKLPNPQPSSSKLAGQQ
jgi:hypothetical protein